VESTLWLKGCFVGRLIKYFNVQLIKENFILGGFNFIRFRYLGEKYVLLCCEEKRVIQKSNNVNNCISNSVVENCNRLFWLKNDNAKDVRSWKIGK